ncbi:MAG: phosphate ABC transporter ATP-binding protein PstB [Myxococcales bacterium]
MSAPRPKLSVVGLSAGFGERAAIREVTLEIRASAVTAIIGPSGCGKSTLLRCLNRMHELGAETWVRGRVTLDGDDLYGPAVDPVQVRRRIGMVFQRPNPFPTLSIFDNVAAGLRLAGLPRADLAGRVEAALQQAALWEEVKDRLGKSALALSGGQQQRLCIARALAVEPQVLLMDEPASALDPIATAHIEELLHELKSRLAVVVVTHNMQQAARISSHTAFLYMGELVEYDRTEVLFTNPKVRRTEDYVTGKFG